MTLKKINEAFSGSGVRLEPVDEAEQARLLQALDLGGKGADMEYPVVEDGVYKAKIVRRELAETLNFDKTGKELKLTLVFEIPIEGRERGAWIWKSVFPTLKPSKTTGPSQLFKILLGAYGEEFLKISDDYEACKPLIQNLFNKQVSLMVTKEWDDNKKRWKNKFAKVINPQSPEEQKIVDFKDDQIPF